MKKSVVVRMFLAVSLFIFLLVMASGCSTDTEKESDVSGSIRLGYCPTMQERAEKIDSENGHVDAVYFGSTAAALLALNNEAVDAVLVGRLARSTEVDDAFELRLREGLTLAGKEKTMIHADDLSRIRIHTYFSEDESMKYIPMASDIVYHDSLEAALDEGIDDVMLIGWDDYSENQERMDLVIPVDDDMKKVERFRIPVLYSYDKEALNGIRIP